MAYRRSKNDSDTYWLVIARDTNVDGAVSCVVCGKVADDVHEILPRSFYGKEKEDLLFSIENRCCVCRSCHVNVQSDHGRGMLLHIMSNKYGYKYKGHQKWLLEGYETEGHM